MSVGERAAILIMFASALAVLASAVVLTSAIFYSFAMMLIMFCAIWSENIEVSIAAIASEFA